MQARIDPGQRSHRLRLDYTLGEHQPGRVLELRAIELAGARLSDLSLTAYDADGVALPLRIESRRAGQRLEVVGRPDGDGARRRLRVEYRVEVPASDGADRRRVLLPLLALTGPPPQGPSAFQAELELQPGWQAYDLFPVGFESVGDSRTLRLDLPAMPALLRLVAVRGSAPVVTMTRAVDAAVVAALLLLAGLGIRAARRPWR